LHPYINLGKIFERIYLEKYAGKASGSSSPALRGSGRTALATAVASCESWGVKKLASKSGLITLPRREGKIFCKKILGGGFDFFNSKTIS